MEHIGSIVGIAAITALAIVIGKRGRGNQGPSESSTPSKPDTAANEAYRVGFAVGMRGGSIEDAVLAQYALRSTEEKTGQKTDARRLGTVLGLQTPPDANGGAG